MDISQPIFSLKASKQTKEKYLECNSHRKKEGKKLIFVSFLLGMQTGYAYWVCMQSGFYWVCNMQNGWQVQWTIPTSGSEDWREEWEEKADISSLFKYYILKYQIWALCLNIKYELPV